MKYKIKPFPEVSKGTKNAEVKRKELSAKEKKEEQRAISNYKNTMEFKEKAHSEIVSSNNEIVKSIDGSSESLAKVLSDLNKQVTGIELNIPELLEGDKISKSLTENSRNIESALSSIVKNINKIKLEIPESQDIKPYVKSLTDAIKSSMITLKSSISELNQSVMEIRLEPELSPVEWEFSVTSRDDKGYIKNIKAVAYYGEDNDG